MDPTTISTAVLALLSASLKVCARPQGFRSGVAEAGTSVNALLSDLGGLRNALESMEVTSYEVDDTAVVKQGGQVGVFCRDLIAALDDGCVGLAEFDELLLRLNKEVRGLKEPQRHVRVQAAAAKMALFRQQIQAYTDTLQLSLQAIILWVEPRTPKDRSLVDVDSIPGGTRFTSQPRLQAGSTFSSRRSSAWRPTRISRSGRCRT
jgi:hypothetical protein